MNDSFILTQQFMWFLLFQDTMGIFQIVYLDVRCKIVFIFINCFHFEQSPPVPWMSIIKSMPFYAILFAHMGQNYGYETLMTELPTYMKQVLRFSIKEVSINGWFEIAWMQNVLILIKLPSAKIDRKICIDFIFFQNGILSALPYLAMWLFSMFISVVADWMTYSERFSHTSTRKVINSLGKCWTLLLEYSTLDSIKYIISYANQFLSIRNFSILTQVNTVQLFVWW